MTWNEAEHPRDELGRFTFNGGGQEETGDGGNNHQYGNMLINIRII